jgi:hypothetical protein
MSSYLVHAMGDAITHRPNSYRQLTDSSVVELDVVVELSFYAIDYSCR